MHESISQKAPIHPPRLQEARIDELVAYLCRLCDVTAADIRVVAVPLRISPLGAHIDHQLGVVTGMAIDQPVLMAFVPSPDRSVQIHSLNYDEPVSFSLDEIPPYQNGNWGNYAHGAALALERQHPLKHGLIGVIGSDMPVGGLSSSAAVTIAYLLALETVNDLSISAADNITFVRHAENGYIGLNNGILDQSVIVSSRQGRLTTIDCARIAIDTVAAPQQDDYEIMIVFSGVTQALVGTAYNNRVSECQQAARLLLESAGETSDGDPRLRKVDPAHFHRYSHRLPEVLQKRARHYFGEMQRVDEGISAWRAGDLTLFGELMVASGDSSIHYYECGSPQLITLHEIIRRQPGVYGARFSGAGFRGNYIALIDPAAREEISRVIHRRYTAAHPELAAHYSIHFCRSADQARLLV